jgi:pimeloyl-ACP methyl ester carboxylesterase
MPDLQGSQDVMTNYTASWAGAAEISYQRLSDGARVRYLETGHGPPLLLMHTLRTQLDYFQRVVPLLTEHFTVYAIDLPGFGWSDIQPGAAYDEPALRQRVVEFVNALDLRELTIAGESIGGALALTATTELDDRVRRVVAFNPYDYRGGIMRANTLATVVIGSMYVPIIGSVVARMENRVVLARVMAGGFVDHTKLPAHFLTEQLAVGKRPGFARVARLTFTSLESFIAARALYARLKVPVTLVYGEEDWSRPSDRAADARAIPNARLITLENTSHFSALERPEAMARILIDAGSPLSTNHDT